MDNKESINWLEEIKKAYRTSEGITKACNMAIEALKKRPSHLRLIKKYQQRIKNQTEEIRRLQEKAASQKNAWTPVTDRLPEEEKAYLCAVGTGTEKYIYGALNYSVKYKKFNVYSTSPGSVECEIEVEAWKEIEPYKESEEV